MAVVVFTPKDFRVASSLHRTLKESKILAGKWNPELVGSLGSLAFSLAGSSSCDVSFERDSQVVDYTITLLCGLNGSKGSYDVWVLSLEEVELEEV